MAELIFIEKALTALMYHRNKLESIGFEINGPSILFVDNNNY